MGILTTNGYIPSTIDEIYTDLKTQAENNVTGFESLPSELRENLIQVSVLPVKKFEDGINVFLNSIGVGFANDQLFLGYGTSFGIYPSNAVKGQVTLEFTGTPGTIILAGTKAKSSTAEFYTLSNVVIPSIGKVSVLANTDVAVNVILANSVTELITIITGVTAVNNPVAGIAPIQAQSIEEYKTSVYNAIQAPRAGELKGFYADISQVEGVIFRLTNVLYYDTPISTGEFKQAINVIVGGGDDYKIAETIFNNFLAYTYIIGHTSDGDVGRIKNITLKVGNTEYILSFTRPRLLAFNVKANIKLKSLDTAETIVIQGLSDNFTARLNSLKLGSNVNIMLLSDIVYDTFKMFNVAISDILTLTFEVTSNGASISPDVNGSFNIKYDEYIELTGFDAKFDIVA